MSEVPLYTYLASPTLPIPSEEATTQNVIWSFACKRRPESVLDCLICSILAPIEFSWEPDQLWVVQDGHLGRGLRPPAAPQRVGSLTQFN